MKPALWILSGVLLCGPCPAWAGEAPAFDVLAYEVRLRPDFAGATVTGSEVIRFTSLTDRLSVVSFSANSLEITASTDGVARVETEIADSRRLFRLPRPLRKGERSRLVLGFKGAAPRGLVFRADTVTATYFTCDFMICDQDRPGDKATIDFTLDLRRGMEAVAPGRLVAAADADGGRTLRWRERRAMPAYLFGFAAGLFERVALPGERPSLPVLTQVAGSAEVQAMFTDTRRMVTFFAARSGVRYPEPAYTQVLVEGSEAQEAASHAVIGLEEMAPILADPHEDWAIAHELAHQWWGNSLTCADWSELWLNEGLTVFMVAAYKEQRWGRADYDRELALAHERWAAAKEQGFDVPLSWKGVYPSLKLKRAMAYAKAVVFLDRLRAELGESAFWRAVRDYTRGHQGGVVTALDLQRALERASGRDLSALFADWVYGA